jgi:hypothetical protein
LEIGRTIRGRWNRISGRKHLSLDVARTSKNAYGVVYEIEGPLKTPGGQVARFCSIWQIDTGTSGGGYSEHLAGCGRGTSTAQALRARTAGRSAGVDRRRAFAGSVATATVFPVMSKNSTE